MLTEHVFHVLSKDAPVSILKLLKEETVRSLERDSSHQGIQRRYQMPSSERRRHHPIETVATRRLELESVPLGAVPDHE